MSFAANCLEAGPNAALKRALGRAHLPELCEIGAFYKFDVGLAFGLSADFLVAGRCPSPHEPSVVTLAADASANADVVTMFLAFPVAAPGQSGSYFGEIGVTPGLLGACTDG